MLGSRSFARPQKKHGREFGTELTSKARSFERLFWCRPLTEKSVNGFGGTFGLLRVAFRQFRWRVVSWLVSTRAQITAYNYWKQIL
ncbi:MAG TPA: hypothetical protein PLR25_08815, partial [Planctomycetaceae bacterium]|nr:hypothetical protein [Planctomycetaceae bacterium]